MSDDYKVNFMKKYNLTEEEYNKLFSVVRHECDVKDVIYYINSDLYGFKKEYSGISKKITDDVQLQSKIAHRGRKYQDESTGVLSYDTVKKAIADFFVL